jgi:imidazolonepropionase-like amidohydrolase
MNLETTMTSTKKTSFKLLATLVLFLPFAASAQEAPAKTLITNVSIFDGKSERLITGRDVLIEGNLISEIGRNLSSDEGTAVIDGGGGTLTPGFIENHAHLMLPGPTLPAMEANSTWEDLAIHRDVPYAGLHDRA